MPRLRAIDTPFLYSCASCGKQVDLNLYKPGNRLLGLMYHNKECYDCTYWRHLSENRPKNSLVLSGELVLVDHTETNPFASILQRKKYYLLKSGQVGKANSLISYGKIPERFNEILSDEGQFIARKLYYRLRDNVGHNCQMKGCYDRYHCYYYHPELTEPDGPWNKIPANYQPGWEGCPLFINKTEIPEI